MLNTNTKQKMTYREIIEEIDLLNCKSLDCYMAGGYMSKEESKRLKDLTAARIECLSVMNDAPY